jgi:hypothetical protein
MKRFSFFSHVTKTVIWLIVFLMAVPPPLIAQNLGGPGFPSLGGTGLGTRDVLPGSPIVTNPSAIQPLAPPQTPCPAVPSGLPACATSSRVDLQASSLEPPHMRGPALRRCRVRLRRVRP